MENVKINAWKQGHRDKGINIKLRKQKAQETVENKRGIYFKIMVNKIDGNNSYTYTKPLKVNIPDTGEKFSLSNEKDGLQAGLKDKEQVSDQEKQRTAEQSGVRIELSNKGIEKQKQAGAAKPQGTPGLASLLETIRTFFIATIAEVRDIFSKIWNNPKPEDVLNDNLEMSADADILASSESPEILDVTESTDSAETIGVTDTAEDMAYSRTDEEDPDREIRRLLQNGDLEQVIRLLTDNGRKTAARNSTLLTFYDKTGRVIKPDASVQQRTLYGDRNTLEL